MCVSVERWHATWFRAACECPRDVSAKTMLTLILTAKRADREEHSMRAAAKAVQVCDM